MARKSSHPSRGSPLVVKVGGSLYNRIPDLVTVLLASPRPLLIVPGGGIFADTVRKSGTDNDSAHWMAIAAMDQYGWFVASHGMKATALLQVPDEPIIFLPYCSMREHDPLPHTWDVTSDSIAAWAADRLGLDLLLLKSVDGILENNHLIKQVNNPVKTDATDPFLIPFVLKKKVTTTIVNASDMKRVERFLSGKKVPCTMIGTTF
jgi:aspartokinase-like uncharacterized kinase